MESLLDNDLYKFTMMYAVWKKYPDACVRYRFINRRISDTFDEQCVRLIRERVDELAGVRLTPAEIDFLESLGLFGNEFLVFLKTFQLKADQVEVASNDGQIEMWVEGSWVDTILWEVPLMAIVSQSYFEAVDTEWDHDVGAYQKGAFEKGERLTEAGCQFSDFGTRRRRSYAIQDAVVKAFGEPSITACAGTSNVHFAMKYGLRPIGTMAHEWIMGHAGLGGVQGASERALRTWQEVYGDKLLIALTDTYTTDMFLNEFKGGLAKAYHGVRHDSECPFGFADKIMAFYEAEGMNPEQKQIVFSDSLNVEKAIKIEKYINDRAQAFYGIGTHFTNDFSGSHALNIVIKLHEINGVSVAKISDNPEKACGDESTVKNALICIERNNE